MLTQPTNKKWCFSSTHVSQAQRPGSSVSLMSACPTPAGPGPTKLPSVVSPKKGAPSGAGDGPRPLPAPDSKDPAGPAPLHHLTSEKPLLGLLLLGLLILSL